MKIRFQADADLNQIIVFATVRREPAKVTCPWHGAIFDVTTGEVLGPPAPKGVSRYNVRVSGNEIEVEV